MATWQIDSDGTYRRLGRMEELVSEGATQCEDIAVALNELEAVVATSRRLRSEVRRTVAQIQRERRLRSTVLRLVKSPQE